MTLGRSKCAASVKPRKSMFKLKTVKILVSSEKLLKGSIPNFSRYLLSGWILIDLLSSMPCMNTASVSSPWFLPPWTYRKIDKKNGDEIRPVSLWDIAVENVQFFG